jgi:aryl-alcohol dehydrogenase-like predicted oxidoreductase
LGWGRLTGKIRRDAAAPAGSRAAALSTMGPGTGDARLHDVVDELARIAEETGRSIPQVAINWLLCRPTVSSVLLGARTEDQLRDNLGSVGWQLAPEHVARLEAVSATALPYPYSQHRQLQERDPFAPKVPS